MCAHPQASLGYLRPYVRGHLAPLTFPLGGGRCAERAYVRTGKRGRCQREIEGRRLDSGVYRYQSKPLAWLSCFWSSDGAAAARDGIVEV